MTRHPRRLSLVAAAVVVALALGGCAGGAATQAASGSDPNCTQPGTTGITDTTIKIGNSSPQSGALASLGSWRYGLQAYVDMVNSEGGIEGPDGRKRTIELIAMDDAYDPSRQKANVDQLVNGDQVFATVGNVGTAANLASRASSEPACVPNLWAISGNPALADKAHPLTLNFGTVTTVEGRLFADYLTQNKPAAKVAILAQNGDFGRPFVEGFTQGVAGTGVTIVGTQTYEPTDTDVRQQVTTLAATGADAFFVVAVTNSAKQAINNAHAVGWKPTILVPSGAALDLPQLTQLDPGAGADLVTGAYLKDPEGQGAASDPAVARYNDWWSRTDGSGRFTAAAGVAGWAGGQLFAEAFANAAEPTRAALVESAHNLTVDGPSMFRPGVTIQTSSPADNYAIEGQVMQRYDPATQTLADLQAIDTNGQNAG